MLVIKSLIFLHFKHYKIRLYIIPTDLGSSQCTEEVTREGILALPT